MKRSIITRLYIGFAASVVLVLLVGIISYKTINRQVYYKRWVDHTYQVMNKVQALNISVLEMRGARRAYRITGEEKFLLPYRMAMAGTQKATDDLHDLVLDNPVQLTRIDNAAAAIKDLIGFWEAVKVDSSTTNQYKTAVTLEEEKKIDALRNIINQVITEEQHLLLLREIDDGDSTALANEVLVGGVILMLIVVFTLIYFILQEFTNRTKAETSLQKSIADITALNLLADKKNWLLTGLAKINSSLHGSEGLAALMHTTLLNMIEYMGLSAAAFYVYDDETRLLEFKSSVGATIHYKTSYQPDQVPGGIRTGKINVITAVPANFWTIQSGSGASSPGEIAILPLYLGNELKGIIEVASFSNFSTSHVELFQSLCHSVAVAVNAAQAREHIMVLLQQVQEQKEVLENQQEELRQSNEELLRQTEVLQASEEELKVQEEELRHINTELEEKNEAVEMARKALQVKAKELDETSRYKSEFLANMSHELRTPLNSVLILASMLADNKQSNLTAKQVEYAGIIHKSGSELLSLINDILDLSKIEAGKIDINVEEVKVSSIVYDITPPFEVLADNKNLNFFTKVDEDVPKNIVTDKLRLEQVIKNLLSNAFKFTPKGGTITLKFSLANNQNSSVPGDKVLSISVKDTGVGIAPDKQRLIFEAFQQADGSTSRKYGGTGLGLSISKELIRILGGRITVTSEPGVGSTFIVYIPLQLAAPVVKPAEEIIKIIPGESLPGQAEIQDERNYIQENDRVMLIIEDDVNFATILQEYARERNYKTIVALSGDEGFNCAGKYVPAAIILDIQLPVLDGWTVLKMLKKSEKLKHIPVHIISVVDGRDGIQEGAISYLKKPVTKEGLAKVFADIAAHVQASFKKILFFSADTGKDEALRKLLGGRKMDVTVTYVSTVDETIAALMGDAFDCMIADIGGQVDDGILQLMQVNETGALGSTQVIICLDKDISKEDEWKLKKFSNVVIRDSEKANQRLIDELDLFLYKISLPEKKSLKMTADIMGDDILAGKKILIADDDMRNVFSLNAALEQNKMIVCTASDGKEALEVLKQNMDTAIVLMDIMMPEMDGYEAIRQIRGEMQLKTLPVIALTAKAMQGDREKSIEAGASDYITKPVDISRLLSLIRVWLSQ